jgi:anaerobic selenocysteine-containing dehydrogenase
VRARSPQWAAAITGCDVATIEEFARLVGDTKRAYFRLGYGFARSRNGAANMHAASCIATVTGAWQYEGGGAFHNNADIYHWNRTMIEGSDMRDPSVRMLDQSRIGAILTGDAAALFDGPPVTALFIQNTNPMSVAPDQTKVKRGFARNDLFVCVHEQFMTETAQVADVVLPATMFLEHDDVYQSGGNQHILLGPKLIEPPGECRSNHEVVAALARRLGARHPGFDMSPRELIDWTLQKSGWGTLGELEAKRWIDCQPDFATAHYVHGFNWPDGKFRFKPDWPNVPFRSNYRSGPYEHMPALPDHWDVIEEADDAHPFRLATSPARNFLNSTFTETPTSQAKERGRPEVMIHPDDAAAAGIGDGAEVVLGNTRGEVRLHARLFDGVRRGVLIAESIWPNHAYADGRGINTLTGADAIAPYGGAAFHDNKVWLRPFAG